MTPTWELAILNKPRFGDACNSCGACCLRTPCPGAQFLLDAEEDKPCPALEWVDGKSRCGMMVDASRYISHGEQIVSLLVFHATGMFRRYHTIEAVMKFWQGAGQGCDSVDFVNIDQDIDMNTTIEQRKIIYEARLAERKRNADTNLVVISW